MAAIDAGSNTSHVSPSTDAKTLSSPQPRKAAAAAAPWTRIVRGESEPIMHAAAVPSASASSSSSSQSNSPSATPVSEGGSENGNADKKLAWRRPSSAAVEVRPVMGAVSWPALSDVRGFPTAKSSSESMRGGGGVTQGAGTGMISSPKHVNSYSTPIHGGPTRQKSMKQRNNATSASPKGGAPQHQVPAGRGVEVSTSNHSPKEYRHRGQLGPPTPGGNDHPRPLNSFRNRNGGPHPRGDGTHSKNNSGRHQDRGNQDWNHHQNFNQDNHMHSPRVTPRGMRPSHQPPAPPTPPPFFPQPVRPFAAPIGFGDFQGSVVYFHPGQYPFMPFMSLPQPPLNLVHPDIQLHTEIINQIDYYFSNENLVKDTFLRRKMDGQGWVPIKLIAGFKKVSNLTENIQIILDALRMSPVVEVNAQGDKIRRCYDWMNWVMPDAQSPTVSSSQTLDNSGNEMLSAHIQSISLDEKPTNNDSDIQHNSQPQLSYGDGAGQFSVHGGADASPRD